MKNIDLIPASAQTVCLLRDLFGLYIIRYHHHLEGRERFYTRPPNPWPWGRVEGQHKLEAGGSGALDLDCETWPWGSRESKSGPTCKNTMIRGSLDASSDRTIPADSFNQLAKREPHQLSEFWPLH